MKYIKNFQVFVDPLGYMLTWEFNDEYKFDSDRWDVYLYRSLDSPNDIIKKIKLPDFVEFYRDVLYREDHHFFNKYIWYQIVMVDTKTGDEYKTEFISINEQEDPVTKQMRETLELQFKNGGAVHGYLFKLRKGGEICDCYNPTIKKAGNPNCNICYGTGFKGGYLKGIDFYGTYTKNSNQTNNKKPMLKDQRISVVAALSIPAYEGDFLYFDTHDIIVKISASKTITNLNSILYQSILGEEGERYDILRRFLSVHLEHNTKRERTYIPFDLG